MGACPAAHPERPLRAGPVLGCLSQACPVVGEGILTLCEQGNRPDPVLVAADVANRVALRKSRPLRVGASTPLHHPNPTPLRKSSVTVATRRQRPARVFPSGFARLFMASPRPGVESSTPSMGGRTSVATCPPPAPRGPQTSWWACCPPRCPAARCCWAKPPPERLRPAPAAAGQRGHQCQLGFLRSWASCSLAYPPYHLPFLSGRAGPRCLVPPLPKDCDKRCLAPLP